MQARIPVLGFIEDVIVFIDYREYIYVSVRNPPLHPDTYLFQKEHVAILQ